LKLKLFGKKVEADSDGDGIIDKNDKCPNEIGTAKYEGCPIPDTDKDGINDEMDKCPNEPGTAKYQGCPIPDTDKDGINDEEDKCPNQPGTAKYQGCPIPDTDGDGINDEEDKCPSQAGPASNGGCPITDRDNDGVSDEEDKCPDVAGTKENNGCPEIPADVSKLLSTSSQNISFGPNSAKLSTTANSSLTKVATVLNEHPEMKLRIEAHADNAEKSGDAISEQRANAVKTYLVSKGISADRIEVQGFGSAQPVADNNTTAGRTKNPSRSKVMGIVGIEEEREVRG
jgi:outer membrane protein OmpA-like peptidoglycan-associated protein